MLRIPAAASVLLCLSSLASAQTQPAPTGVPSQATPATTPVVKKAVAKSKPATKQPVPMGNGPCRIGVISALGDRFSVEKFGLTVFETDESYVPIEDWGLDDLVFARVRAATRDDPTVRKIAYPKGAFEPYFNPKSRLLPDPREGLPAIVRGFTAATNCERYLVVTRVKAQLSGNLTTDGVGVWSRGIGSLARRARLHANFAIDVLDGTTYEKLDRAFAGFSSRYSFSMRLAEDSLSELDNSQFPEPAAAAASSQMLRDKTRALLAARLDHMLPDYLEQQQ
jgi:hypothetical protein